MLGTLRFAYMDVGKGREQERKLCPTYNKFLHTLGAWDREVT